MAHLKANSSLRKELQRKKTYYHPHNNSPGTNSNRHSENTVNPGSAVAIDIAGSRKRAASSSNVESQVQKGEFVLNRTVKDTPSPSTPIDTIPIPRNPRDMVRTADAAATDVSVSRKRASSSEKAVAIDVPTS